jgi:ribose transport system substrate-binding protein
MKRILLLALVLLMALSQVAWAAVELPDPSSVLSTDGQVLMPKLTVKEFPARPDDPSALPEDDSGHYYDMEFAGWNAGDKVNIPTSPADGPKGKKIILIVHGDHPWTTAYINGAKKACEFFGMTLEAWSPNWDVNVQNQLIDQAINAHPDAIGLIPLNAESAVQQFRKINEAGIPVFGTNTLPTSDAMKYMISWTGPDDWGQMRLLADKLADAMGKKGGICYITHNAGTSPYFARTYGPITEFKKIAPDIKTLDIQTPGFDAVQCKQVVSDWITRFGDQLNAIFLADDSAQAIGTIDAIKEAGRKDILVVAAGNSKQGMDLVKSGDLLAINYQTAEGDGAAVIYSMAKWFAGQDVPAIGYLAQDIITKANVDGFYPPQW